MAEQEKQKVKPTPKPLTKDELIVKAIESGVPSYEAWTMSVDELTRKVS